MEETVSDSQKELTQETAKNQEELKKAEKDKHYKEFMDIKDFAGNTVYTCNEEEFTDIISDILMLGKYTKTFSLYNGKIELTYETIVDKDRAKGYALIRKYTDDHKNNYSNIELESYTSKVNIALQLVRVTNHNNTLNIAEGDLEERMQLLEEVPELQLSLYSKWLGVFANLTNKAFNFEDALKNF